MNHLRIDLSIERTHELPKDPCMFTLQNLRSKSEVGRRFTVACWFIGIVLSTIGLLSQDCSAVAKKPVNIIFLMTDDQASYSLGCYGNPDVKTPNIDQLARQGMMFDRHYTTTAICMGSRATVMTGLYEYRHGCNFDRGPLAEEFWQQSYPNLLRRAGYVTAFAGKFGFEVEMEGEPTTVLPSDDFDVWGGGPGQTDFKTEKNPSMTKYAKAYPHASRAYGAFGADFIKAAATGDKPFCLSVSFKAPHRPVQPDPVFDGVYQGAIFLKPANYGREFGQHFSMQSRQGRQYERFDSWGYRDQYDEVMAKYHQLVYGVDVAVGMIMEAVQRAAVADNTVIIFTSDNGYFCGSHGYGSKVLPYEEGSRVPLIIFDPRHVNSGKNIRCQELSGSIDFAPTILDLAGVRIPRKLDGRSLLPLYDQPQEPIHESLQLINVWGPVACHSFAVMTKQHKYIYWPWEKDNFKPAEEIYDIPSDPLELVNIAELPLREVNIPAVNQMRKIYAEAVGDWTTKAFHKHGYSEYGPIFDRDIPWK